MKTEGTFKYVVNGESKTKEEIDSMDLSNMDCTVENLTVSYSFPRKSITDYLDKESIQYFVDTNPSPEKVKEIREKIKLQKLIDYLLTDNTVCTDLGIIHGIMSVETEERLKELIRTKTDEVNQYQEVTKGGILKGGDFLEGFTEHQINRLEDFKNTLPEEYLDKLKDDVIINSSRGEKEMMSDLVGVKETEGKLDYSEINFRLLDLMAKRFMDNKAKYPKGNSKKVLDKNEILLAAFRHIRKMIQPIENDPESYEEHLAAVATNLSIILDQLDLEKSK